jgi:4-hydroxy-2-oxoheptanedioate aldolase
MPRNALLEAWGRGETTLGLWCSIGNSFAAELVASTGFDYACADLQHGVVNQSDIVPMLQAIERHGVSTVVRVPWCDPWQIMRALDAGADGVIVPLIETPEDATTASSSFRYPPRGKRSYGPTRVGVSAGTLDPDELQKVACILQIESITAVQNVDRIAAVGGIDALYVGPADLALSMGRTPRSDTPNDEYEEAIERVRFVCVENGITPAIHCLSEEQAVARVRQGFQMVTVGIDAMFLRQAAASALSHVRSSTG